MRAGPFSSPFLPAAAVAMLVATMPSCGSEPPYDWKNREIPWTYGPTNSTATREHLNATGTKGPGAIAKGWSCRLRDGKELVVQPYQLASTHALFGKVLMNVGMFDASGKQLGSFRSAAITAENASSTFEVTEEVARPLCDVVIWFREP